MLRRFVNRLIPLYFSADGELKGHLVSALLTNFRGTRIHPQLTKRHRPHLFPFS